jgi:hypothetical protein
MYCWKFKQCGREAGGARSKALGVCPAYPRGAGQACWLVVGTFCREEVQGVFREKPSNCEVCDFYQLFDEAHRARMRKIFGL